MEPRTRHIRSQDARAMLRLVNELHALPPDPITRKHHLLQSLCTLLRAKVGTIVYLVDDAGGNGWQFQSTAMVDYGWPCAKERAALWAYREDVARDPEKFADPMAEMLKLPGRVVTRRRRDLHPDDHWYRSGHVNEHRRPARVDYCLYTLHRLPQRAMIGLGLQREWGDRIPFGRREVDLLHLLNEQLGFVWQSGLPPAEGDVNPAPLAPRLRQTLDLLLRGRSEKEIASHLGLSRNTVHKYVTALYRHFHVTSRAELMARQLRGRSGKSAGVEDAGPCNGGLVN